MHGLELPVIYIYLHTGDRATPRSATSLATRGHGRLGNCHQFRKQRHALSCGEGRVKKNITSTGGRPPDVRRCECAATARTTLRVRSKDSPTCEDSTASRDRVLSDLRVPPTAPPLRRCRGKRPRRRSPRLTRISANSTT